MEGFDPATGATTWSVPLAASAAAQEAREMYKNSEDPVAGVIVGDELGWVPARSGPRVLAWSDGSSRSTDDGSVLFCADSRHFAYATDDPPWLIRNTDTYRLCTSHRRRASTGPPSPTGLAVAGTAAADGLYLVSFADRVVTYHVG